MFKKIINEYSMALSLIICNLIIVSCIYKSSILYCLQFLFIIFCFYFSLKLYEKYRTNIDNFKYLFLKGKQLEFYFIILLIFSFVFSLYFDILKLNY